MRSVRALQLLLTVSTIITYTAIPGRALAQLAPEPRFVPAVEFRLEETSRSWDAVPVYAARHTHGADEAAGATPAAIVPLESERVDRPDVQAHALRRGRTRHITVMALGFATSILAHEAGHVLSSMAVGGRPTLGFDNYRPVVYSGIDAEAEPQKQLLFSSAGLVVQMAMDELILDIPHARAGAFERGILAGGIGTGLFYAFLGRNSSVSDVTHIAATSGLSKADVGMILGSISMLHALRVARGDRYADFFAVPAVEGMRVGVVVQ